MKSFKFDNFFNRNREKFTIKNKIILYSLLASLTTSIIFLMVDWNKHFSSELIEFIILLIFWIMYLFHEKRPLLKNNLEILKFSAGYSLWMIPITLIIKLINLSQITPILITLNEETPINVNLMYIIAFSLTRFVVSYIFVIFVNLIYRLIVSLFKKELI